MKRLATVLAGAVIVTACCLPVASVTAATQADDSGSYATAYAAARAKQTQAVDGNCAWSVTDDALKSAEKLHKDGKDEQAAQQAKHAETLAELSIKQCREEQNLWQRAVVGYSG